MELIKALTTIKKYGCTDTAAVTMGIKPKDLKNYIGGVELPNMKIQKRILNYAVKLQKNIITPADNYNVFYKLIDGKKVNDISKATGINKVRLYYYINNVGDFVPNSIIDKLKQI